MAETNGITADVKEYYGKILKTKNDLKTSACTTPLQKLAPHMREVITQVHDEVVAKYYGCGLVVPECLEGRHVLDMGSGSGRDCYILSKLVGEKGYVTGIDMTEEQIAVSQKYVEYHRKKFGFEKANTKFVHGYIEDLKSAGIDDNSVDIIISNCVINLCKNKEMVLQEAYRVLRNGGEMYFSDVYADRNVSEKARSHKVLWGECISGALYWKDLYMLAKKIGFELPRVVKAKVFTVKNPVFKEILGDTKFISVTYRLFKLPENSYDGKKQVIYNGSATHFPEELPFDHIYTFKTDKIYTVDESTAAILKHSRFCDDFDFNKAPCCAKATEIGEVDPFTLDSLGVGDQNNASCCSDSQCC